MSYSLSFTDGAGTNDNVKTGSETRQRVPLDQYIANLHQMLHHLTSGETYPVVPNIILIVPGPCYSEQSDPPNTQRDPAITKQYAEQARKVGEEWKAKGGKEWVVEVVDTWNDMVKHAGGEGERLRKYFK